VGSSGSRPVVFTPLRRVSLPTVSPRRAWAPRSRTPSARASSSRNRSRGSGCHAGLGSARSEAHGVLLLGVGSHCAHLLSARNGARGARALRPSLFRLSLLQHGSGRWRHGGLPGRCFCGLTSGCSCRPPAWVAPPGRTAGGRWSVVDARRPPVETGSHAGGRS
jgi:hypothetical protein